ncbi:MAG: carboxypeptidase regulatory-like domain-containing protein [Planctomycetaceae bacterium]|nr:carboxypeptidase regulatory-like domain-containing protein [Planctomycetaceae bacterium]
MKSLVKFAATGLTCLGLAICSPMVMAAGPVAKSTNNIGDIALAPGGTFYGHVVDAQGSALDGTVVKIYKGKVEVASAVADQTGLFAVKNLKGGVYRVTAGQADGVYRFWTAEAAPPSATTKTVLVSSPQIVRGQLGGLGGLGTAGAVGAVGGLGGLSIININEAKDLNDDLDDLQKQLKDTQDHLDEIEDIVTY